MSNRGAWVHPSIKAILLFGFAAYIAYLVKSDRILFYISPRMVLYVKLSALGLYAAGAYQLYTAVAAYWGKRQTCDCGHDHSDNGAPWKSAIVYGLFAFPLLLGFLMPDTSLGSSLAAKKGMNLNSAASVKSSSAQPGQAGASYREQPQEPVSGTTTSPTSSSAPPLSEAAGSGAQMEKLFPFEPFTEAFAKHARKLYKLNVIPVPEELYIETLTTLDLYAEQFTGKKVKLSGFVYRDDTMNTRQFVIGRFSVQCCSADAAPFGVLVDYDRAAAYATDQWVEITGTIGRTKFDGSELMVVKAEQIAKIEPPKEQYVYPNSEFGS
ncbi:TIGR03943 family protein [Paenibacillus hemerocallicola]|uniref:TIGR03943 family protein n=1 Tax=Paenibacillus hemerocallicola TaxID=1172614 RepID=A0A5C4SWB1_9BACL|nr:TIGR03943 family protein [Paenibacillus hemerocallicola]TNJ58765.1 TIGR03943 family protein [Paenibacillus hemerocallicola]